MCPAHAPTPVLSFIVAEATRATATYRNPPIRNIELLTHSHRFPLGLRSQDGSLTLGAILQQRVTEQLLLLRAAAADDDDDVDDDDVADDDDDWISMRRQNHKNLCR